MLFLLRVRKPSNMSQLSFIDDIALQINCTANPTL